MVELDGADSPTECLIGDPVRGDPVRDEPDPEEEGAGEWTRFSRETSGEPAPGFDPAGEKSPV